MDLYFNRNAAFTRWVVASGVLHEPFVVLDIGVQGGEHVRWHLLGDHLVVHGFDAIKEVIDTLQRQNRGNPNRHYHWIAAGNADEEREFFFNAADPFSSSFYPHGEDRLATVRREQARKVRVRRLDTLLRDGVIAPADFLKTDVEGFEKDVFLGAPNLLRAVLGIETETNFDISPVYPKSHLGTLQEILIEHRLLVFDLNFNRIPRATFQRALAQKGIQPVLDRQSVGYPTTFNVLFCRDTISELDHPGNYARAYEPLSVDQLIKLTVIYELHGLNDIAVDTLDRFRDHLAARFDVEKGIDLLADPFCRTPDGAAARAPTKLKGLRAAFHAFERRCGKLELSTGLPVAALPRAFRKAWHRFS